MLVEDYYVALENNLESRGATIVGSNVYDDSEEIMGNIVEYNDLTGCALIHLNKPIEQEELIKAGIEFENMVIPSLEN